jgi:hypothetical protein
MFTSADCLRYVGQFSEIHPVPSWIVNGWAKPGIENYPVESRVWEPGIHAAYVEETADHHRIVLELRIPDAGAKLAELVSWPRRLTEEILLPKSSPEIQVTLSCFEKRANRLPEAMWFSFSPDAPFEQGWRFEKVDQPVSPHDVVSYGGRHLHGVTRKVTYRDSRGVFVLETLDASLVAPGQRKLTDFDNRDPEMHGGVHVNLFNNLWNTAFPHFRAPRPTGRYCKQAASEGDTVEAQFAAFVRCFVALNPNGESGISNRICSAASRPTPNRDCD